MKIKQVAPGEIPAKAREYFGGEVPTIAEVFRPGKGWASLPYGIVTYEKLERLSKQFVTAVGLKVGSRIADFSVREFGIRPIQRARFE